MRNQSLHIGLQLPSSVSKVKSGKFFGKHPLASGKSEICLMPLKAPYCYLQLKISRFKGNMFKENLLKISRVDCLI